MPDHHKLTLIMEFQASVGRNLKVMREQQSTLKS